MPIETEPGENHVVVDSVMRYRHDGEGLHRAVDPADGRHYIYAMPFLDAAPSIFGCFDQPDLKAVWTLRVRTPHDWVVLGNSPPPSSSPATGSWRRHCRCRPTSSPSSPGPYHVLRNEHDGIPLGLSARASIARHLDHDADELFTLTRQSFDELHRLFGMRYPFGDYHQAFVPEFNAGAMESAGCVTFRDPLVFQSRVVRTDHVNRRPRDPRDGPHVVRRPRHPGVVGRPVAQRVVRRVHGARVAADVTEFTEAWLTESYDRRSWGLSADQRPSTHPVAGNGAADGAAALQNFDGISYAKGASILKQLNSRLGDEVFFGRRERPLRQAPLRQRHHGRPDRGLGAGRCR